MDFCTSTSCCRCASVIDVPLPSEQLCVAVTSQLPHTNTHTHMYGLCLCVCNLQRVCVISGQHQKQSQQQRTPSHASCLVPCGLVVSINGKCDTERERGGCCMPHALAAVAVACVEGLQISH